MALEGGALQLGGIHHIAIKAHDVEGVAAFYREVLGLPETRRNEDEAGLRSIWLRASGVILMVERTALPGRPSDFDTDPPGLHLVALAIDARDRAAWRSRLVERGCPIAHETRFTLYVLDPEGNRIGLSSYPESLEP